MFTAIAAGLLIFVTWQSTRGNDNERKTYDNLPAADRDWLVRLHVRQDLKLIALTLSAILVMLGVIADAVR